MLLLVNMSLRFGSLPYPTKGLSLKLFVNSSVLDNIPIISH